ncbi:MAG: ATP-binding protein, partial [Acidobacteriota bacterium]
MLSTVDLSFRRRALTEAARYGSDPWVFVRELLQNARDAGAREVTLTTSQVSSSGALRHRIACCDDGQGMTYEHARRYLFSLYASSKDDDLEQAGKFGIGFWSILRLAPTAITIRSRAATGKAWEVTLDGDLEQPPAITTDLPSSRFAGRGTEVILELPLDAVKTVAAETTEAAKHYGRFLTCRDDPEQPLNIRVDGLSVNATFTLPAPSAAFSGKGFRGVVGLGEEPEVELFAQGLFVRSAPSLLDLREDGDAPNRAATEEALAGLPSLAPRILIDSAELDLMLARSDVRFDKHMRRILAGAEKALARLIRKQLQAIRPQPWYRPLLGVLVDRLQPLLQWRPQLRWRYAAAGLAGILLGTAVLWWLPLGEIGDRLANGSNRPAPPSTVLRHEVPAPRPDSPRPGRSARRMRIETGPAPSTAARPNAPAGAGPASQPALRILPYADLARSYSGPHLGGLQLDDARTGIMYEPSDGTPFFNALVIDRLQAEQWEASRLPDALPRYRETPCQENCLDVRLLVADGPTPLRVPVATGHRLDASSVRLNGDSVAVFETEHGEAILQPRDRRQGLLEYRSGPAPAWPAGTEPSRRATLDPGTASPPLREVAAAIRPLPIAAGVQQALDFVARTITYDRTPATLRAYGRAVRERSDFVTAALDVGAGDCDVQNGVLLTLLRLSGIEARLVLGYVGLGGTVATG